MKSKIIIWPILAGSLVGIIYWFATMGKVTIMGINIFHLFAIAAFFAGVLLRLTLSISPLVIFAFVTLGAEIAIIAKIVYDIQLNISSHNLLGLDILSTAVVISLSALTGAYLGKVIQYLRVKFFQH